MRLRREPPYHRGLMQEAAAQGVGGGAGTSWEANFDDTVRGWEAIFGERRGGRFSGFTREMIGELDNLGKVPCAFRVLSAFAMGAK